LGEVAALLTSAAWSFTSIQFTLASRRVGSQTVNRTRLSLAVLYLSLAHLLLQGELWPIHAELSRWGWLGVSGTIGLVIGDACLYQAFVLIGPRLAMLLMALAPVIGTLVAWGWLGEILRPIEIGAVLLAVSGVAWVVSERPSDPARPVVTRDKRRYALGVLLGIGGASGQALGLVIAKQGLVGDFPALSATLIRMVVASCVIWLLTLAQGQVGATWRALKDGQVLRFVFVGSVLGPFIGVWLSMVAVQHTHVGIASTLMALSPIMVIPLTHLFFKERVSPRSVAGTVIALAGVAIIFLT